MLKTTVIVSNRNDSYKSIDRFAYTTNSIIEAFDEVIIVDWNTDEGVLPTISALKGSLITKGNLRHIIIPPKKAAELIDVKDSPCKVQPSIALNIAIRRATGDIIVITGNDDIAPSRELLLSFIDSVYREDTFYTVSRREIDYEELIKFDPKDVSSFFKHFASKTPPRYYYDKCTPNDWFSIINCCGDFQLAHRRIWNEIKGYEEKMIYRNFTDTNAQKKAILKRFKLEAYFDLPVFHITHEYKHFDVRTTMNNDHMYWVEYFNKSENTENWGFPNEKFEEEVL